MSADLQYNKEVLLMFDSGNTLEEKGDNACQELRTTYEMVIDETIRARAPKRTFLSGSVYIRGGTRRLGVAAHRPAVGGRQSKQQRPAGRGAAGRQRVKDSRRSADGMFFLC